MSEDMFSHVVTHFTFYNNPVCLFCQLQMHVIGLDKSGCQVNIFLISPGKHMLMVLLEVPRQGTCNEYPQHKFS